MPFLEWSRQKINDTVIQEIKDSEIIAEQLYATLSFDEIVNIEFHKMLEANLSIKKCKNCDKYFILKGDYATDYCDRIPEGENQTCKRIAAIKTRKEKVHSNPVLKEFQKAYKRNYARRTNNQMPPGDFQRWLDEAIEQRDTVSEQYMSNPSDQILQDFKKYLGNK